MTNKAFFIIIIFIASNMFSQNELRQLESMSKLAGYLQTSKVHKEIINGVEYEVWMKNNNKLIPKLSQTSGTCFFIHTDFDRYLVTSAHVAKHTSLETKIVVSNNEDNPIYLTLGDIIEKKDVLSWTMHPNADVAVVHLKAGVNDNILPFISFDLLKVELAAPYRSEEVTVFGYPLNLGIGKKVSSISKTSNPSSGLIDLPRFDNGAMSSFYLLDDPSVSGFSGGPVFKTLPQIGSIRFNYKDNIDADKIVGLVHGTINNKAGGFAAIVPSYYIKETIELAPGYTGNYKFTHSNGKLWSERIYLNGTPIEVISNYNSKEKKQKKGTLKNGSGTLFIYNEKDELIQTKYYKTYKLIKLEDNISL